MKTIVFLHDGFLKVKMREMPQGFNVEYVDVRPTVAVLVYDANQDEFVVVQQHRVARDDMIEVVAGYVDGDERPVAAAIREAKEETGAEDGEIQYINSLYTSPGYSTELIHFFRANQP